MRIARLELRPFGSFADRTLHFGEGDVDLHLVVGANEAGKSTMLAAIGDLLWGIHERTPFNFRFDYGDLRLGGRIEHGGEAIDFVRRKSRANQLLGAGDVPIGDGALAPFLGSVDRDAFDRMFGLDYERLRRGGRDMLAGKDDVARVLFEAESGLAGIGHLLDELDCEAEAVFSAQGRTKPLHLALKERDTQLALARSGAVQPSRWRELARAREEAQSAHDDAVGRASELETRRSSLERDQRVRPIVAKIDLRLASLAELGDLPALDQAVAGVRDEANVAIRGAADALGGLRGRLTEERDALTALPAPSALLAHADEIARLADMAELHRSNAAELATVTEAVDEHAAKRRLLLVEAGMDGTADVPSSARVRAARKAAGAASAIEERLSAARDAVVEAERSVATAERALGQTRDVDGLPTLRAALDAAPRDDAGSRRAKSARVEVARIAMTRTFAQLSPWVGNAEALGRAVVPAVDVVEHHRAALADLADRRLAIGADLDAARELAIATAAAMARLHADGGDPPTPQALAAARDRRDAAIRDLAIVATNVAISVPVVAELVRAADALADRREAEAARVAEHARLLGDEQRARLQVEAGPERLERLSADEAAAADEWRAVWSAASFMEPVAPLAMTGWLEARRTALDAADEMLEAEQALSDHDEEVGRHAAAIRQAMPGVPLEAPLDDLVRTATTRVTELQEAATARAVAVAGLTTAREALEDARGDEAELVCKQGEAGVQLAEALSQLGLGVMSADSADEAVGCLERLLAHEELGAEKRLRAVELARLTEAFDIAVQALADTLAVTTDRASVDFALTLRRDLAAAEAVERERERRSSEVARLEGGIATHEEAERKARATLAELMEAAGVVDGAGLDLVIERCAAAAALNTEIVNLRDDLVEAGGGLDEAALRAELGTRSVDNVAADLVQVKLDQQELVGEVSSLAAKLAEARSAEEQASAGTDAADAAQAAEAARATVVELSERYIRSRGAAAMLRWAINRHRETRQAPLLSRAGQIFAGVTGGRFTRLVLDWSRGEEPVIVAERAGGERCGVDDMSEGTRDQLFLALRLAAIEERSAGHAMPLVCDDLLITADDGRAGRLMIQLAELSRSTQVICFTHHQHLVGVAEQAIGPGSFQVHHVNPI